MMDKGNVTGYICQGFNPVASFPDKNKVVRSLSQLKYMTRSTPARLYQLRSKMTISPAAGRWGT
jgi:hypothetical protein